jgi:catechol 2,3-dioxygenase-like lactoylglutathione lyase family enzyme
MKELTGVSEFRLKLYPKDFYKVREFYETELGYRVVNEWDRDDSKGVMFDVGGTVLELLTPETEYKAVVGADVSWEVSDVWQLFEEMKDKPYVIRGLKDNDWGDTSLHIQDPEGFKITFFTKTSRSNK